MQKLVSKNVSKKMASGRRKTVFITHSGLLCNNKKMKCAEVSILDFAPVEDNTPTSYRGVD